jgi:uncharacterized protein YbdZ (MbtH family)
MKRLFGCTLLLVLAGSSMAATVSTQRAFLDQAGSSQGNAYLPGQTITVRLTTIFDGSFSLWAAEDLIPAGWDYVVDSASNGGVFNEAGRKISWTSTGNPEAEVTYKVTPDSTGTGTFDGGITGGFGGGEVVYGTFPNSELSPNMPPTEPSISVTGASTPVRTATDLVCTVTTTAIDEDNFPGGGGVEYEYTWSDTARSVIVHDFTSATQDTLSSSQTSRGTWACSVRARDGAGAVGSSTSDSVTVVDTPPTPPSAVTVNNTRPTHEDAVTATASGATDADGDTISYVYRWTRVLPSSATVDARTLAAGDTSELDRWQVEAASLAGGVQSSFVFAVDDVIVRPPTHPADTNADGRIELFEFLTYAGPVAAVFQNGINDGEYEWDGQFLTPVTAARAAAHGGYSVTTVSRDTVVTITRTLDSNLYVAGRTLSVELDITVAVDAGVVLLAVEENIPAGWSIVSDSITGNGVYNANDNRVSWSITSPSTALLTYQIVAPGGALEESYALNGLAGYSTGGEALEVIIADSILLEVLKHLADSNLDCRITLFEYLAYAGPVAAVFQQGINGGEYEWDGVDLVPTTTP